MGSINAVTAAIQRRQPAVRAHFQHQQSKGFGICQSLSRGEDGGARYQDSFSCSRTTSPTMIKVGGLGFVRPRLEGKRGVRDTRTASPAAAPLRRR